MTDPWESPEFLIERACDHAKRFNALAGEFIDSNPYTVRKDLNADTGLYEIKVKLAREFPKELRGAASDAVKNIRDALDQCMSAATFVLTGKRYRRTHFPFGESEDDLENSLSRRKARHCRDIPEELFPAIRFIKPYPHEGDNFRLKLLQKVAGDHKHTVALTLGSTPIMPISTFGVSGENGEGFRIDFPEWDGAKGETIIATYPPHAEDGLHLNIPLHIAFDHPELRKIPAATLIEGWGQRTDWIRIGLKNTAAKIAAERSA